MSFQKWAIKTRLPRFLCILSLAVFALAATAKAQLPEVVFWQSVRDTKDPAELRAYLKAYPSGQFATLARIRLNRLKTGSTARIGRGGSPGPGDSSLESKASSPTSQPPIHQCDRLAAFPFDQEKVVAGVFPSELHPDEAITACRAAVKAHPGAPRFYFQLGRALHKKKRFVDTLEAYRTAADRGYMIAAVAIARMYLEGQGVPKNEAEAVKWTRRAAEKGLPLAMALLGIMYHEGQGVAKDQAEALRWIRKAAKRGEATGMFSLGAMYIEGHVTGRNEVEGFEWIRRAAAKDFAPAMDVLGDMYRKGQFVERDFREAVKWYRRAAERGYPSAMLNLGDMYEKGFGVGSKGRRSRRNFHAAAKWYQKAANKGHSPAMERLAKMYEQGHGVTKNLDQAAEWKRKASDMRIKKEVSDLGLTDLEGLEKLD